MITPDKTSREPKKEQVREMFDSIAPRYDLLNQVLSFGISKRWRKSLVRMVIKDGPKNILDVATGTGDMAIVLAKRMPMAKVTGVDLSPGMLKIGREKVAEKVQGREVRMIEGDAENLPFGDGEFDGVTAVFGVRNFGDLERGLSEMCRVLKPGGKVYVLEFSMPKKNNLWGMIYRFYFRNILPAIGRMVSGDRNAYTYLPQSVGEFPYGERFETLLGKVGFGEVGSKRLMSGIATIYRGVKR